MAVPIFSARSGSSVGLEVSRLSSFVSGEQVTVKWIDSIHPSFRYVVISNYYQPENERLLREVVDSKEEGYEQSVVLSLSIGKSYAYLIQTADSNGALSSGVVIKQDIDGPSIDVRIPYTVGGLGETGPQPDFDPDDWDDNDFATT